MGLCHDVSAYDVRRAVYSVRYKTFGFDALVFVSVLRTHLSDSNIVTDAYIM